MYYQKVELYLYKHIQLTQIKRINIDFQSAIHLLLGTNGSGKSSVMRELSLLPSSRQDYELGGYKKIWFKHNNKNYVSISDFSSKSPKYTLTCLTDDTIIADQVNMKVMKEFIQETFNITDKVRQIQLGASFCKASVNDRKQWLKLITNQDYDYALNVYNQLTQQYRDSQGVMKHLVQRHHVELEKQLGEVERVQLRTDIKKIEDELNNLLKLQNHQTRAIQEVNKDLNTLIVKVLDVYKNRSKLIIDTKKILEDILLTDVNLEKIESLSNTHKENKNRLEGEYHSLLKLLEETQNNIHHMENTGGHDLTEVNDELEDVTKQLEEVYLKLKDSLIDVVFTTESLNLITEQINHICEAMPKDDKDYFTNDTYSSLTTERDNLHKRIAMVTSKRDYLIAELNEVKSRKKELECPSCLFKWDLNDTDRKLKDLNASLEEIGTSLNSFKTSVSELDMKIAEFEAVHTLYSNFSSLTKQWPQLNKAWLFIRNKKWVKLDPVSIISLFEQIKLDNQLLLKVSDLKERQRNLMIIQNKLLKTKDRNIDQLKTNQSQIEKTLKSLMDNISDSKTLENKTNRIIHQMKKVDDYTSKLLEYKDFYLTLVTELERSHFQLFLKSAIPMIRIELFDLSQKLDNEKLIRNRINDIETQIKEETTKQKELSDLIKALSPKEGLIAESMMRHINQIIDNVNQVITTIWSYPLELLPIGIDDESGRVELNYKFPTIVNDDKIGQDISLGSSAMQEVIDLAFRLTTLSYLGFSNDPLYLDEFGHSMDSGHRQSAYNAIKSLIDQGYFNQAFIISHNNDIYASSQVDVTVLCDQNIEVPLGLNANQYTQLSY